MIDSQIRETVLNLWADNSNTEIRDRLREDGIEVTANQILGIINQARVVKDVRAVRKTNAVYG